jgi:hypothetical protein
MFSDNAVGRGGFILVILSAILAYGYLLASLFWLLPVKVFGPEAVKWFYGSARVAFLVFLAVDLFVLENIRDHDRKKHEKERMARPRNWGRQ